MTTAPADTTPAPIDGATAGGVTTIAAPVATAGAATTSTTAAAGVGMGSDPAVTAPTGGYASTSPVYTEETTAPIVEPLADGRYAATSATSDATTITLRLGQNLGAADCATHFGIEDPEEIAVQCASPPIHVDDPSTTVSVAASTLAAATVLDAAGVDAYRVTGAELARLLAGQSPSPDAPASFVFSASWGLLVTVEGGAVIDVAQMFHS